MTPRQSPQRESAPAREQEVFPFAALGSWIGFVLRSVVRHKLLAAVSFLAVAGISVASLAVIPFRYQVQASLLAQRNPLMGTISNPGLNREWDLPARAAREVVLRRENLVALCRQTNFVDRYLATRAPAVRAVHWIASTLGGGPPTREELLEGLVDSLEQRLTVWANTQEGTVNIAFEWSNPELAFDLVSAAVDGFIETRHVQEINAVGETIAILQEHDARVRREIADVTQSLEEKQRSVRVRNAPRRPVTPLTTPAHDDDLPRLEAQLGIRRRALADLEDFRSRRLAELQAQLTQQLTVYAPQHPAVLSTKQSLEGLGQPSSQVEALRAEVSDLEAQVVRRGGNVAARVSDPLLAIQNDLTEARLRLAEEDPRLEVERNQLALLLRQHSNLLERIDAARVELDTAKAAFKGRYTVTTPPQMPRGPVRPKPLMVVLAGLIGGVAFALFASAAVDIRSGRVLEAWQVERELELEVIGDLRR